jgi:hypothetical protein
MAAVVSVLMAEPRKTPWFQSKASKTSGITWERREPKEESGDRHALRIFPVRGDRRALDGRGR